MFALSMWAVSGSPFGPLAPSSVSTSTGSVSAKLPSSGVKPMGGASRWSWKWLTYQKACTAFCRRFVCQLLATLWFQEHKWALLHVAPVKGVNRYCCGTTSSPALGASAVALAERSSMSDQAWANGPDSAVVLVRYGSRFSVT